MMPIMAKTPLKDSLQLYLIFTSSISSVQDESNYPSVILLIILEFNV
jgi:hypothetical protein